MSKVSINESTLVAIGDSIREKTGKTGLIAPGDMPTEIASITTGGGGGAEVEPIVLTGDCSYGCQGQIASNYIKNFGDTISTNNLTNTPNMFFNSSLEKIPFELNYNPAYNSNLENTFGASNIKEVPKINQCKPANTAKIFISCNYLRYLPEDIEEWFDWTYLDSLRGAYGGGNRSCIFQYCYSLRSVPMGFLNHCNPTVSYGSQIYYMTFYGCYSLDEIVGLPIPQADEMEYTVNMFNRGFNDCTRLKNLTFATNEDGTPIVVKWKNQNIDLRWVGCSTVKNYILNYNSGITADKEVTDDATYQALKDDSDWWTMHSAYSRYNHDSAVATINSLPDTSAYLAEKGGTNTIQFTGAYSSATDGGAINTLTEEEIAVAAAKGWTVTLV